MRFSEAHHRQVVATSTASKVGRVDGFVIEPAPTRVGALRVGGCRCLRAQGGGHGPYRGVAGRDARGGGAF